MAKNKQQQQKRSLCRNRPQALTDRLHMLRANDALSPLNSVSSFKLLIESLISALETKLFLFFSLKMYGVELRITRLDRVSRVLARCRSPCKILRL